METLSLALACIGVYGKAAVGIASNNINEVTMPIWTWSQTDNIHLSYLATSLDQVSGSSTVQHFSTNLEVYPEPIYTSTYDKFATCTLLYTESRAVAV